MTIEMPDDLARNLESVAAAQHKSLQQLAIERLSSLVEDGVDLQSGSPTAVLRVMQDSPHLTPADVDELDQAIAAGRLAVQTRVPFSD